MSRNLTGHAYFSKSARRCVAALQFLDQHIAPEELAGDTNPRESLQVADSNADSPFLGHDAPGLLAPFPDSQTFFLDGQLQAESNDL
jgi:hypothetical protein